MDEGLSYREEGRCSVPAELAETARVAQLLRGFCAARGLGDETTQALDLLLSEGLNNAIEHGCKDRAGARVEVSWAWKGENFVIEVADPGAFLPAAPARLPEDPLAERGRGLYLLERRADQVEHCLEGGRHVLRLTKKVGRSALDALRAFEFDRTITAMADDLSVAYEGLSVYSKLASELAGLPSLPDFAAAAFRLMVPLVKADGAVYRTSAAGMFDGGVFAHGPVGDLGQRDLPEGAFERRALEAGVEITAEGRERLPAGDPLRGPGGCALAVPVFFQGEALGTLAVVRSSPGDFFNAGQIEIVRAVAEFLGVATAAGRLQGQRQAQQRAARELEIAAEIQRSLYPPSHPSLGGYETFGLCESAQEVGGDYYDVIPVGQKGLLLAIADVMGKGIPAALVATVFRTAVRSRLDLASSPETLLVDVRRQMAADLDRLEMFVTALLAYVDVERHCALVANAGHCPPVHWSAARGARLIEGGSGPLGVDAGESPSVSVPMGPGDALVLLTDGIYEVAPPGSPAATLGLPAVLPVVSRLVRGGAFALCTGVLEASRAHCQRRAQADDQTVVAVRRRPPP
jgi:serine phosphatase RsbU (regulator of sigma subunit)/anti-sigma regulatory factor (Ser/Thr protein kinase)